MILQRNANTLSLKGNLIIVCGHYKGWKVPEVLLSGNEKKIEEWKLEQACQRTKKRRPDLFEKQQE